MNKQKLKEILNDSDKSFSVKRDNSDKIVDNEFIKKLRNKHGYTQLVFSSILGVSVKTIEKWEQGSVEPRAMIKKFLYLLDKYPLLFNQLYSYESHEKLENSVSTYYVQIKSFNDEFKERKIPNIFNESKYKHINENCIPKVKNNNVISRDCCPAS